MKINTFIVLVLHLVWSIKLDDNCLQFDDADILFLFDISSSTGRVWPKLVAFSTAIMQFFETNNQNRYCFVHFRSVNASIQCATGKPVGTTQYSCIHVAFKESETLTTQQIVDQLGDVEDLPSGTPTYDGFKAAELQLSMRSEQDRRSVLIFVGDGGHWGSYYLNLTNRIVKRIKRSNTTIFTARCSSAYNDSEPNLKKWASSQNEVFNCDKIAKNSPNDTFKYQRLGELVAQRISRNICSPPTEDTLNEKQLFIAGIVGGILAALFLLLVAILWSRRRKVKLEKNEQVQVEPKVVDLSQGLGASLSFDDEIVLPRVTPIKQTNVKRGMKMVKVKKKTV